MRVVGMQNEEFNQLESEGKLVKSHNLFRSDVDHTYESYVGMVGIAISIVTLDELNNVRVSLELTPEDLATLFKIIRTVNSQHLMKVIKYNSTIDIEAEKNIVYIKPHKNSKSPVLKPNTFNFSYSELETVIFSTNSVEYSQGYSYWFNSTYLTIVDESKGLNPVMIHRNTLLNALTSIIALNLTDKLETSYLIAEYNSHSCIEENYLKVGSAYLAIEGSKIIVLSEKLFYYATATQGDITEEIKSVYEVKAGRLLSVKISESTHLTIDFLDHTDEISVNVIDITEEAEYGSTTYLALPVHFNKSEVSEQKVKRGLSLIGIFSR